MADNTSEESETRVTPRRQNTENAVENNDAENTEQQPPPQESVWKSVISRIVTFWIIMQVVKSFTGKKTVIVDPNTTSSVSGAKGANQACSNLFKNGDPLELYLYYSESEEFTSFDDKKALLWHQDDIKFGSWYDGPDNDGLRKMTGKIKASDNVLNNGSLYYHIYIEE